MSDCVATSLASNGIGQEIFRLRLASRLSVAEAARRSEVSRTTLHHWESGRYTGNGRALDRLLIALGASKRDRARVLAAADPGFARLALAEELSGAPVEVGQVVRAMRLRRTMSQSVLAAKISVTQGTIAKWETGALSPDVSSIHALCFALGASAEEVAALSCSQAAEPRPERLSRHQYRAVPPPIELREVVLLGMEADAWWSATKDPHAEANLCDARAERAKWYAKNGRLAEVEEPAYAALQLAKKPGNRLTSTVALWSLFELSRRSSGRPSPVRLLTQWSEMVGDPAHEAWLLGMIGMAHAAEGRQREALSSAQRALDIAVRTHDAVEYRNRLLDLAEMHLLLNNPEEAYETLEREDKQLVARIRSENGDFGGLKTRARVILASRELPEDDVMDALRKAVGDLPTQDYLDDLAKIERSYERVATRTRVALM